MIEIQFDAGGRRCVAALRAGKTPQTDDAALAAGVEYVSPLAIAEGIKSYLIHSTKPLIVNVGTEPLIVTPDAPQIWFAAWGTDPIATGPITATATEEGTQLSIVLVQ